MRRFCYHVLLAQRSTKMLEVDDNRVLIYKATYAVMESTTVEIHTPQSPQDHDTTDCRKRSVGGF